jgi:predicted O-methyltransferase YrrM
MRFDDVWMQPWQLGKLAELASRACSAGAAIEIGTHQGLSAIPIANVIYPKMLHVVDHWEGSTDFRSYMRDRDNYSIFVANATEGTRGNIEVHKQDWRDFARGWTSDIGFLHLDAEHSEEEVSAQIGQFLLQMAPGSVIAGDDYDWPGVRDGVAMHFKIVNTMGNKLWWVTFLWA